MKRAKRFLVTLFVVSMAGVLSGSACDKVAEQCGFVCASEGIASGNASITGVASIDGFFQSVVNFQTQANLVSSGIDRELALIAASVGLEGGAGADFSAEFQAALRAQFDLAADLEIDFQPPRCEISASATVEAAARCDVSVDAGSVSASCEGKCEVEPGELNLEAACEGEATAEVTCTGTAPGLACEGSCTGSCELSVAASCEGTCKGSCSGSCSFVNASGECEGDCDGQCEGSCELAAGGSCEGSCTGSCEYTPPSGECSAGASVQVECKVEGSATPPSVNCSGSCSGEINPPSVSAECEASVKAEAELNATCHPPSIEVYFELVASGDVQADLQAEAEFKAWLNGFKARVGALLAASAKADLVVKAGAGIVNAAVNVVGSAAAEIDLKADPAAAFKIGACLPTQLSAVPTVIGNASASLNASVQGSMSLMGSLGK